MRHLLLAAALPLLAQTPPDTPATTPVAKPLSFFSQRLEYAWDQMIPLKGEVDGIRLNSIFFNRRGVARGPLKGVEFGTRAQVEVSNTSKQARSLGFAVAVFDEDERLVGVASGGTRFFSIKPGSTESFDLSFSQVIERLPLGKTFVLSLELGE